jgi:heat shock protein HtpX
MWELIKVNQRKSLFLFLIMGICLLLLGYFIGSYWFGSEGWAGGIFIAFIIWVILSLLSYYSGDSIILAMSKAKRVTPDFHPQLYNIVEEMKIAGNLPAMPKIYIIPEQAPNAFATGRDPKHSSVAVTAGLLAKLNRDELQGVIAHEVSHIINRDILFMTFSGVMLGSIVFLSHIFLRSLWFSGGRRSRSSSKNGGQIQMIVMIIAILFAILSPIIARLLYFAISRKREYLADASAVRLTRYPEGLASALEKIADNDIRLTSANKATAGLYIANPLNKKGRSLSNLTSTHPPIDERVKILRGISSGANYRNYQEAYSRIKGGIQPSIIPRSGITDSENIELRSSGESVKGSKSKTRTVRDLNDILKKLENYKFLACSCGLQIKVPKDFKGKEVKCPRCGELHDISTVSSVTLDGVV